MMKKKAFVLLSGGLDSTTCLAVAKRDFGNVEAISIDYGQRHIKETEQARKICEHYKVDHTILPLRQLLEGGNVMLTDKSVDVPDISYSEIQGISPTYVPFRNGTMLAAITAHAQKYVMGEIERAYREYMKSVGRGEDPFWKEYYTKEAKDLCGVYFGAHAEDAHNWAYPDCTPEFIGAMANAIYIGSYFSIRLYAPFMHASKADIVSVGSKLNVPYEMTWSCYKGEELHCGTCPTCQSRKEAFVAADVTDPTPYASDMSNLIDNLVTPPNRSDIGGVDTFEGIV